MTPQVQGIADTVLNAASFLTLSEDILAEFPALPLFTDAFIADTTHLNAAQTGAYLMLLIVAWRTKDGTLPDDDKILARYARMEIRAWKANREIVLSFWKRDEEGNLYQPRLLDERENVASLRRKNVEAGKASALKRKNRGSTSVPTKPQPKTSTPPHPLFEDTYVSSPPTPKTKFQPPDWIDEKSWSDFVEFRIKIKKPMTDKAKNLAINELGKLSALGHHPTDVINQSILRGWTGLFPITQDQKGNQNHDRHKSKSQLADEATARAVAKLTAQLEDEPLPDQPNLFLGPPIV